MVKRGIRSLVYRVPHPSRFARRVRIVPFAALACLFMLLVELRAASARPLDQINAAPFATSAVTIVLPPELMAAHPATLAVFGVDGKLAPAISVALSDGESVTTDRTGRAHFTAPASGMFLLAQAEGATATALIDPATGASESQSVTLSAFVSLRESFWLCGPGLHGDATADSITINSHPALVLAASPECLITITPPATSPGIASIIVTAPGVHWVASTTFVSLAFTPPHPALLPGQKGRLAVRVQGSAAKLNLVVENTSPDVLRFLRGDVLQVRTSGGANNSASIEVQASRSGDFSFHARVVPPPDPSIAARYLQAAASLAVTRGQHRDVEKLAKRLSHHPRNVDSERRDLTRLLDQTIPGNFRALLSAAFSAL
ncbi:MAG: hypothetical protein ACRD5K_09680 [Candidatus Acidiferrales bacterium]